MDYFVLDRLGQSGYKDPDLQTRRSSSLNSSNDSLNSTGNTSESNFKLVPVSETEERNNLTPTAAKTLYSGAQRLSALCTAIQSADVLGAVRVLAGEPLSPSKSSPSKRSWWSRKTANPPNQTSNFDDDFQVNGRPRHFRRGAHMAEFAEGDLDEMSRCWNMNNRSSDTEREFSSSMESALDMAEYLKTESAMGEASMKTSAPVNETAMNVGIEMERAVAKLLDDLDSFKSTLQKCSRQEMLNHSKQLIQSPTSDQRKRARFTTSIIDYVGGSYLLEAAASYVPYLLLRPQSSKRLAGKIDDLKEELLELVAETNMKSLQKSTAFAQDKLCDSRPADKPLKHASIPPPPPPPPPPQPSVRPTSLIIPASFSTTPRIVKEENETSMNEIHMISSSKKDLCSTSLSIKDAIRQKFNKQGTPSLRNTQLRRSPGGTPLRRTASFRSDVQVELFEGLKRRFQTMQVSKESDTSSDSSEDECFSRDGASPCSQRLEKSRIQRPEITRPTPATIAAETPPISGKVKQMAAKLKLNFRLHSESRDRQ